jgi:hypothetical protein
MTPFFLRSIPEHILMHQIKPMYFKLWQGFIGIMRIVCVLFRFLLPVAAYLLGMVTGLVNGYGSAIAKSLIVFAYNKYLSEPLNHAANLLLFLVKVIFVEK